MRTMRSTTSARCSGTGRGVWQPPRAGHLRSRRANGDGRCRRVRRPGHCRRRHRLGQSAGRPVGRPRRCLRQQGHRDDPRRRRRPQDHPGDVGRRVGARRRRTPPDRPGDQPSGANDPEVRHRRIRDSRLRRRPGDLGLRRQAGGGGVEAGWSPDGHHRARLTPAARWPRSTGRCGSRPTRVRADGSAASIPPPTRSCGRPLSPLTAGPTRPSPRRRCGPTGSSAPRTQRPWESTRAPVA